MLEVDPRRRLQAHHLIKEPYVTCEEVRMTAFEMASTVARQSNIHTFKRDIIKVAHNKAVELLVSILVVLIRIFRGKKIIVSLILSFVSKRVFRVRRVHQTQTRYIHCTKKQWCSICCIQASKLLSRQSWNQHQLHRCVKQRRLSLSPRLSDHDRIKTNVCRILEKLRILKSDRYDDRVLYMLQFYANFIISLN